jgi:hypothetical protein
VELLIDFEQVVSWFFHHGFMGHIYISLTLSQMRQLHLFCRSALLLMPSHHTSTLLLVSHIAVVDGIIQPNFDDA